ncbi:MAG: hypothetical protein AAGH19_09855 [Pseudomonadota bacterium]
MNWTLNWKRPCSGAEGVLTLKRPKRWYEALLHGLLLPLMLFQGGLAPAYQGEAVHCPACGEYVLSGAWPLYLFELLACLVSWGLLVMIAFAILSGASLFAGALILSFFAFAFIADYVGFRLHGMKARRAA